MDVIHRNRSGATCGRPARRRGVLREAGLVVSGAQLTVLLREEVRALRARESRRVFDPALYVGSLLGGRDSFVVRTRDLPAIDRAVRVDVVSVLVARLSAEPDSAWLTRPGGPDLLDTDADWLNAARDGFAMHGCALGGFWVVTPTGFSDVRTGRSHECRRRR